MKKLVFLIFLTIVLPTKSYGTGFEYEIYARLLDKYVHTGKIIKGIKLNVVDYEGFYKESQNPLSDYSKYLRHLSQFNPETLNTRDEQVAFWINAYNIGAIKIILDHYPVDSIKSFKLSLYRSPWGKKILNINDRLYSLDEIEHDILLGRFRERMAHFAVVCASLSCPDIAKQVYKGENLTAMLAEQARAFLSNPSKGVFIDRAKNIVYVSKIFKFDSRNFSRGAEDIIPFILPFIADQRDREYLENRTYKLDYPDYNWDLNTLKNAR